ncbi:MAG TPA: acyl-CoA dehydrogenase family protein, partial [Acidimicrobiia bacterium]
MNIYLNEDLRAISGQIAEYVEREIVPSGEEWEQAGRVPRDVLRRMGEIGFFGLRVEEEYGGIGLGPLTSVVF